jgi:signal transduction histidine kinase
VAPAVGQPVAAAASPRVGIRRKIWIAFILQGAAISFAAVLGVYGASAVLKHVLIQRALQEEAAHFWGRLQRDPRAAVPDTYNMSSYLLEPPYDTGRLPAALARLQPGFHSLPRAQGGSLVLVDERGGRRLYLLFKQEQVDSLAFWFGMAPLALVLGVIYLIAWITYRSSKRAVSPLIWLAEQVRGQDGHRPDVAALHPDRLPRNVEDETLALALAIHEYASRSERFLEREREFTRHASHELRTPLTVIRVAADLMEADGALTPASRKALARIQSSTRDMEALIESFLILAREGDTGLRDEEFAVSGALAEEIDKAQALLAGKPVRLSLEVAADFRIEAPPRVFAVLVGNLLRNACHYTDAGEIRVRIANPAIEIADSGIGMSEEELARVFEPFYRGDQRRREGQGIGLSIVRRLSERYGWTVGLSSRKGAGSVARVEFPRARPVA